MREGNNQVAQVNYTNAVEADEKFSLCKDEIIYHDVRKRCRRFRGKYRRGVQEEGAQDRRRAISGK